MRGLPQASRDLLVRWAAEVDGAPEAEFVVAPGSVESAAAIMDVASEHGLGVRIWGGGQHQPPNPSASDIVMSTSRLTSILFYEPDDLTVTVEPGVTLSQLEERLDQHGQTAVLPETSGSATVGGVVAVAASPYRRLRFGPVRDRMLGVVLATGDGRVVHGGGNVVKNVTGYDLPRLATGSLGALGLIGRVTLKLWPEPIASATVTVGDAGEALDRSYRPLAVLQAQTTATVYLAGPSAQLESEIEALEGDAESGLRWPARPEADFLATLRVPPAATADAVGRLDPSWSFLAEHGVGLITIGSDEPPMEQLPELRDWVESLGGALVMERSSEPLDIDRWGTPPSTIDLQRRMVAAFDPIRISNPGVLPGDI